MRAKLDENKLELEKLKAKAFLPGADFSALQAEVKTLQKATHYKTSFYQKNKSEIIQFRKELRQLTEELAELLAVKHVPADVIDKVESQTPVECVITQDDEVQENTRYLIMMIDALASFWKAICDFFKSLMPKCSEVKAKVSDNESSLFGTGVDQVIDFSGTDNKACEGIASYNLNDDSDDVSVVYLNPDSPSILEV